MFPPVYHEISMRGPTHTVSNTHNTIPIIEHTYKLTTSCLHHVFKLTTCVKAQKFQNIELTTSTPQELHFENDQTCPQFDDIQAVNLTTWVITYFALYGDRTF